MRPLASSAVIDSRLVQVFSLSAEGADGMVISGTRLEAAGAAAIAVKSGVGVVLSGNRIGGTKDGAGIRLSGVLKKVALLGNLVASGGRNGVQIDGTTQGLVLRGNVLTDNAETGLAIRNASCVAVQGNIIAGNGASGVTLSRSGQVRIAGNAILANGSAGLDVEAQAGPMLLSDNLVADNREGLRGAGLGETHLAGNDLADQLPRQFAGDFAPFLAAYLGAEAKLVIPAVRPTEVSSASCPTE
jgi:nitrous oxidase accessory protein NosD